MKKDIVLDSTEKDGNNSTNRTFAIYIFLFVAFIFIAGYFFITKYTIGMDPRLMSDERVTNTMSAVDFQLKLLVAITIPSIVVGFIFLRKSLKNNEPKKYPFWITLVGLALFLMLSIIILTFV